MRTNVDGHRVPVVLGWPLLMGAGAGIVGVAAWSEWSHASSSAGRGYRHFPPLFEEGLHWIPRQVLLGAALLLVVMFVAGWWDDRRGDERPRGFAGHLSALRGGRMTGGVVKLVAGGGVGLGTAVVLLRGFQPFRFVVVSTLVIALAANLMNLLDRAPGRAGKSFLALALPLAVFGDPLWRIVAAGALGATAAILPLDLKAKGMLGDAGANPLGAVLGLGLVVAFGGSFRALVALAAILLALNLASEKWSFSRVIEQTPWLARLDHLGRK
jgi:UDP-N-acetylmuramyl pentapeptide phosphotransferase/UDP-N-acetylglucosamine-1-phosphate transferase